MWVGREGNMGTYDGFKGDARCEEEGTRRKNGFWFCEDHYKHLIAFLNPNKKKEDDE
jgi:hypothetical protein